MINPSVTTRIATPQVATGPCPHGSRTKRLFVLFLALVPAFCFAQKSLTLTFPTEGEHQVWFAASDHPTPDEPTNVTEKNATLTLPNIDPKTTLYVLDKATGNIASVPAAKLKGTFAPKSFDRIGVVHVQVTHGDKPVAAAEIRLQDPKQSQEEFLDPSSKGQVDFYAVNPGQIKLTVNYKSEGKPATPVNQLFTLSLQRTDQEPTLSVALPDKVETIGGAATTTQASEPAKPKEKAEAPNPIGRFGVYLLGLAVAVAAVYFAIQYMKKNQELVTSKLEDLGVQIPKPQDDGQPDDLPAAVPAPKPEPPQKIVLDNAQPDILGVAAPAPMATATVTGQPRLVSADGDELPLEEGELTVGRDAGLGLSLATESTVSRKHAVVARSGSTVRVTDLGSTNGTFVNGVRLSGDTTLQPGDTVQFGAVRFRYEA